MSSIVPRPGQYVKLLFRNGLVEQGIVVSWSSTKSVLKEYSSNNLLIIQKTDDDVFAIKVIVEQAEISQKPAQKVRRRESPEVEPQQSVLVEEEPATPNGYQPDPALRALDIAKLRILRGEEERKQAKELLTSFRRHTNTYPVEYGLPRRIQKPPNNNSST